MYLHTILKNHTAHACEGETLVIECPSRTSVSVLSAFYGRRVPNQHLCPSANSNTTAEEDTECTSPVAVEVYKGTNVKSVSFYEPHSRLKQWNHVFCSLQKVVSECQDRRSCHIPVFSPVFGQDPCPLTTKYLLVAYKCRPGKLLRPLCLIFNIYCNVEILWYKIITYLSRSVINIYNLSTRSGSTHPEWSI